MNNFIEQIHNVSNIQNSICELFKKTSYPIVVYCTGVNSTLVIQLLHKYSLFPECFCDDNPSSSTFYNRPVYTYEEFRKIYHGKTYYLIIANITNNKAIFHKIICSEESNYICRTLFPNDFIDDVPTNYQFINNNKNEFSFVYDLLKDKLSQQTLVNIINYKISGDAEYLWSICRPLTYFHKDLISLKNNEIFVDCGAFDGDTISDFMKHNHNRYKEILAFEPDIISYKKLKTYCANLPDIKIFNIGLWHEKNTLCFKNNNDMASNICGDSDVSINVNSLDSIVNSPVSFIKMDIEGAELNALHGAINLIQNYKPKLAICVYHRKRDMIDIPIFLHKIRPDYKLYLRHCSLYNSADSILYAL